MLSRKWIWVSWMRFDDSITHVITIPINIENISSSKKVSLYSLPIKFPQSQLHMWFFQHDNCIILSLDLCKCNMQLCTLLCFVSFSEHNFLERRGRALLRFYLQHAKTYCTWYFWEVFMLYQQFLSFYCWAVFNDMS